MSWQAGGKSPAEIEADIEQTRERVEEDLDAIQDKLRPARIRRAVVRRTRDWVADLLRHVREHPVPAIIIGTGIGWLVTRASASRR